MDSLLLSKRKNETEFENELTPAIILKFLDARTDSASCQSLS
jgi:hypothetical protein